MCKKLNELIRTQRAKIDALVATEVMGWFARYNHWWKDDNMDVIAGWSVNGSDGDPEFLGHDPFRPSTDIAAAWQVVEYFRNKEYDFELRRSVGIDGYVCWIGHYPNTERIIYFGDDAPLAICRAALMAVMEVKG